jgi:hypothetical protein
MVHPAEVVMARASCLPGSATRAVPVQYSDDLLRCRLPLAFSLFKISEDRLRRKMAVVLTNRRLVFLAVSSAIGDDWTALRTVHVDYVVGVRVPGPSKSAVAAAAAAAAAAAEIVFADDVIFALQFSRRQRRAGRKFVQALGTATSIIDRSLPI